MAILAIAAPVTPISSAAGVVLPAAEPGVLTGLTGWSVPNNGLIVVRLVVGAAGAGSVQFVAQRGSQPAAIAVANSTIYLFSGFDPSFYSDGGGLLQATITVVTGNTVGAYILPAGAASHVTHNPFEANLTMADI